MASQRDKLVAAIRMYEASPDKAAYPVETLRNMMGAAQQEGINWSPDFSMKRAGMSFLDNLALGLIPGDYAVTKGERFAGNLGSVGSFFAGGAAAKGLGVGAKAVGFAKGGASAKAARGFERARGYAAQAGGRAGAAADEAISAAYGKGFPTMRKAVEQRNRAQAGLDKALGNLDKAEKKVMSLLDGVAARVQPATPGTLVGPGRSVPINIRGNALARGIEGAANFGASGAISGLAGGIQDGNPIGGMFGGAVGGSLLGAVGGAAASTRVMQGIRNNPETAAIAAAAGLTGLAYPAY